MFTVVIVSLLIAFALAVYSLRGERSRKEIDDYRKLLKQTQIKGTIVLDKDKPKHYSSYS